MSDYSLYLVTDHKMCLPQGIPKVIANLLDHGISCVQLRMKNAEENELAKTGKALLDILRPYSIKLIINDHLKVAKQIDADGIHLGQNDTSIIKARAVLGKEKIIGLSIENFAQAQHFATTDVDYFGVGPIFSTNTKRNAAAPIGIETLRHIRSVINKPIVAFGGINHKNAAAVLHAGADGIAVVSAILAQANRVKACAKLHSIIQEVKNEQ